MDDLKKEQKRFTDITIQINLALWTSLITVNGIIIAVFAIITASLRLNILLSLIIAVPSVISCFLIIHNFLLTKKQYEIIMEIFENLQEITEIQKEKNLLDAEKKRKIVEKNNGIVIKLMLIQVFFFILLIYFAVIFPNFINFILMKDSVPQTVILNP